MVRVLRRVEVVAMATDAGGGSARVLSAHVALGAGDAGVCACQREAGRSVIEVRPRPRGRRMTLGAGLRKSRGSMRGIFRIVEIVQVATDAIAGSAMEIPAHVALRTRQGHVRAGQGEAGEGGVIEHRSRPGIRVVALRTRLRKAELRVIGIGGRVEIFQMAGDAVRRRPLEMAAGVTGGAIQASMRSGQGESAKLRMIETGALPGVHGGVALVAGGGETGRLVVGRLGAHVRPHVTTGAVRRQALELPGRGALVARTALEQRVRAHQRKTILMFSNGLHGDSPSHHRMALLALRAHLAAVNVGVALGALLPDVGKDRLRVALRARHSLVHPAQRIARTVVVELGNVANRLPSAEGVAVLARDGKRSMRTASVRRRRALRWGRRRGSERHRQQQ